MSSFLKKLKNPKTGKEQIAWCIDDFYAEHIYGYFFKKDGKDAVWEDFHTVTTDKNFELFKSEEIYK